ncbi:hypothetical protein [Bermanella sp. R86510]|uniref:hypothetical protein n=1 Tax=unclassified Bermanella TaxID=2627862 RepID=UPI0037CAAD12
MIVLAVDSTFDNPFLPKLRGKYPDKPFGEIKIDFGNKTYSDASWQKICPVSGVADDTAPPIAPVALVNASGVETNMVLSSAEGWRYGGNGPDTSVGFPDNLGSDYIYIGDSAGGAEFYDVDLYIDGLSKKKLYNLEIFASRTTSTDKRVGYYTANGVYGSLDAADNIENTLLLENIAADEMGRLTLNVKTLDSNFAYLNAIVLRES